MANSRPEALPASCWIDRAGGDDFGDFFRLARHFEVPGQQIFGAQGKQRDRNAGGGAVERFGGGAVAPGGNDGPQPAGAVQFVGPRADFRAIGDQPALQPPARQRAKNRSSRWCAGPEPAFGLVRISTSIGLGRQVALAGRWS